MILTADYHTHTKYSHGKGTVLENALSAKEKGLKEIGIADHGPGHYTFGLSRKKIPSMANDCKIATQTTGVKVLAGVEANIISKNGRLDVSDNYYDYFDILLCGIHKFVAIKPNGAFDVFIPDLILSVFRRENAPKRLIKENTKTFINVIKNNPVDIITHLNFCCYADSLEVAKCASDYGTYIELNSKKTHLTDEELSNIVAKTSAKFVIDSDAHTTNRVGEISLVENLLSRVYVSEDRIDNINGKTPNFRFKAFKEKTL